MLAAVLTSKAAKMSEIATTINGIGWAETLETNRIRDESSFDYEVSGNIYSIDLLWKIHIIER